MRGRVIKLVCANEGPVFGIKVLGLEVYGLEIKRTFSLRWKRVWMPDHCNVWATPEDAENYFQKHKDDGSLTTRSIPKSVRVTQTVVKYLK